MTKRYEPKLDDIIQRIERLTPEERAEFPEQYYDPIRLRIAQDLAIKEYYKLMPFLSEAQFDQLETTMLDWYVGKGFELGPVHDYWNIVGSFTETLKLKELVFYLSSANVSWELQEFDPQLITLRWGVGDLTDAEVKTGSWTYEDVANTVLNDPERLGRNKKLSDERSEDSVINRDHFPIVVLKRLDGSYFLLDGNRRTMRAWLYDKSEIQAWVGTVTTEPALKDYWVSPAFLRRLLAEYAAEPTEEVAASIRLQLKILFEQTVIAKHLYMKRCLHLPGAKEIAEGLIEP